MHADLQDSLLSNASVGSSHWVCKQLNACTVHNQCLVSDCHIRPMLITMLHTGSANSCQFQRCVCCPCAWSLGQYSGRWRPWLRTSVPFQVYKVRYPNPRRRLFVVGASSYKPWSLPFILPGPFFFFFYCYFCLSIDTRVEMHSVVLHAACWLVVCCTLVSNMCMTQGM